MMKALTLPAPPKTGLGRLRWALADGLVVTRRNLAHIRRTPQKLFDVTIQPIVFVFLFGYVFGSAIAVPGGGGYIEYVMPGIFVFTMMGTLTATAVGFADDLSNGIVDRFRSLPMASSAVLIGRSVSDLLESVLGLGVLLACGLVAGWRPHNSPIETLGAFGLLLLLAVAMNCVGVVLGLLVRTPEVVNIVGGMLLLPAVFLSNIFVPTQGMPTWLRTIADWNPLSATVAACRTLFGNPGAAQVSTAWPLQHPVVASVGWSLLLLAVLAPLAVRSYRTATIR
jgi:ABC-2 type transport system permease protein